MALWLGYALAISVLLAAGALAAEKGLDLYRKPTRWCWLVALVGSVAIPAIAYLVSTGWLATGGSEVAAVGTIETPGDGMLPLPLTAAELAAAGPGGLVDGLRSLDPWLLGGCVAVSLAAAGWLLTGWLRLLSDRRGWRRVTIGDVTVWISPDEGPAVTGFFRGDIVLPAWYEELDRDLQQLVFRHEREHLSSGDHRLFGLGLATVLLSAWNPVMWWSLARLRQAMEIDCDRRVVERGVSPAAYGELLVMARRRTGGTFLSAASLAASQSLLERRIRSLASPGLEGRSLRAVGAAVAVLLAGAAGGALPAPAESVDVAALDPGPDAPTRGAAARRTVVPPVPAVMGLDLRLYLKRDSGASGGSGRELDVEAIRLAKRLAYGCAPYLGEGRGADGAAGPDGGGSSEAPGGPGCVVVMDGRRVEPTALREIRPGTIEKIDMLPADAATERYGADGRGGAFVIRTSQG